MNTPRSDLADLTEGDEDDDSDDEVVKANLDHPFSTASVTRDG